MNEWRNIFERLIDDPKSSERPLRQALLDMAAARKFPFCRFRPATKCGVSLVLEQRPAWEVFCFGKERPAAVHYYTSVRDLLDCFLALERIPIAHATPTQPANVQADGQGVPRDGSQSRTGEAEAA